MRPAVVILDVGDDDFVGAPVTSQLRNSEFDIPIREWRGAGLNVDSFVRVYKLTVLPKVEIVRSLGRLSQSELELLIKALCKAFCR